MKIDLNYGSTESKYLSRVLWQKLLPFYTKENEQSKSVNWDSFLCDLYTFERFFIEAQQQHDVSIIYWSCDKDFTSIETCSFLHSSIGVNISITYACNEKTITLEIM